MVGFGPISEISITKLISKASGKTLSIGSCGPKWASTECETKVSFQTQVAYFFREVSVKFIFGPVKLSLDVFYTVSCAARHELYTKINLMYFLIVLMSLYIQFGFAVL